MMCLIITIIKQCQQTHAINHQLQLLYMMVLQAKTIILLSSEIWKQTMDFIVGRINNMGNIKVLCTQCKFFLFSVDYLNDLL